MWSNAMLMYVHVCCLGKGDSAGGGRFVRDCSTCGQSKSFV